jgi:hypothetical protein
MQAKKTEFEEQPVLPASNRSTNHLWFDKVFYQEPFVFTFKESQAW